MPDLSFLYSGILQLPTMAHLTILAWLFTICIAGSLHLFYVFVKFDGELIGFFVRC